MRIHYVSDLHLDHGHHPGPLPAVVGADVLILAGDLVADLAEMAELLRLIPYPIVYVLGNHEWYGHVHGEPLYNDLVERLRVDHQRDIHLLDPGVLTLANGWRILGCTWWCAVDWLNVQGTPAYDNPLGLMAAQHEIEEGVNDFRAIKVTVKGLNGDKRRRRLQMRDALRFHHREDTWLREQLAAGDPACTVVVTHFVPTAREAARRYPGDACSAYFANTTLDRGTLPHAPAAWVAGHCHWPYDQVHGHTRVLMNPGGYPGEHVPVRLDAAVDLTPATTATAPGAAHP